MADPEIPVVGPFRFVSELLDHASENPALAKSPLANRLLMKLGNAAATSGQCWPSIHKLADRLGTEPKHVRKALEILKGLGYVQAECQGERTPYLFKLPIAPPPPRARPGGGPPPSGRRRGAVDPRAPLGRDQAGQPIRYLNELAYPPAGSAGGGGSQHPQARGPQSPQGGGSLSPGVGAHSTPTVNRKEEPETEPFRKEADFRSAFLTDDARPPEAIPPTPTPSSRPAPGPSADPKPPAPSLTATEARALDSLAMALVDPKPETVNLAANLMGTVLDKSIKFVGGYRQVVWDGSKLGEGAKADILGRFEAAVLAGPHGRGRRFLKEVRPIVPRRGAPPAPAVQAAPAPASTPQASPPAGDPAERVALYRRFWPRLTPEVRQRHLAEGNVPAELVAELSRTVHLGRASA